MRRSHGVLVLALATVLTTSTFTAATAGPTPRAGGQKADLKVTSGSVAARPLSVTGTFKVKNAGKKKSKRTTTALLVDGREVRGLPLGKLAKGKSTRVSFTVPATVGSHVVRVCADARKKVAEKKEGNNCRTLGRVDVPPTPSPTAPSDPIPYSPGTVFPVDAAPLDYSLHVPTSYASHHQTPTGLVVFLGGCGNSTGQVFGQTLETSVPDLAAKSYIVMTPQRTTPEGCWDTGPTEQANVLAAIADVKTHFNIAPRKVVVAGYSSGGFLAGATAFNNVTQFAGVVTLCAPAFSGTTEQAEAIGDAGWRLNVVMRGHTDDGTVLVSALQQSRDRLQEAGFPVAYSEVPGLGHGYVAADFVHLLGAISSAWTAP